LLSLVVSTDADSGSGSLRAAIAQANSAAGPDGIRFSLPVGSVIQLQTALPPLSDTSGGTTIDGDVNGDFLPDIVLRGKDTFDIVSVRSSDNIVRNLVIQNGWAGVHIYGQGTAADRNQVLGCYIGTDRTGMEVTGTANRGAGVWVGGTTHDTVIGGPGTHEGNIIAGSGYHGIQLIDAVGASVQGNYIGLGADGNSALGNQGAGVSLESVCQQVTIGGVVAGARNVISGNSWDGIVLNGASATGNIIQGNRIGTNAAGSATLGNGWNGISTGGSNNTIGGAAAGARNVISGNGLNGVRVWGDTSTGNGIRRNVIYANMAADLDLNGDGWSPNDPGDVDGGANGTLNYPELYREPGAAGGFVRIAGRACPGATIELFQTDNLYGRGDARVSLTVFTADPTGHFAYEVPVRPGGITATATDTTGNTSEFSPIVPTCSGTVDAEYLLITNDALAASFQPLVDRRTAEGKPGKLITVEWIAAHYDGTRPDGGNDLQTKIRNCVQDYYEHHGTRWLAIGGDDSIVPARLLGEYANQSGPCDLYYGVLTGTWDSNANGVYAEAEDQDADVHPQVMVGRIPVRSGQQVQDYIGKLVTYENSPPAGYSRTLLLAGSAGPSYETGTARAPDQQDHELISRSEQLLRSQYWQMVQPVGQMAQVDDFEDTFTRWDTHQSGDYDLSYEHLLERLDWGYETVILHGHGNPGAWGGETANVDTGMAPLLTNAARPSIFMAVSCSTAAFDLAEPSLAEALLRNPHGGAVAYLGGVRAMDLWDTPLPLAICARILEGAATLGQAAAWDGLGWAGSRIGDRWNVALLGDPALQLLAAPDGRHLQMLSPVNCEVVDSDRPMLVRWNAGGMDFTAGEKVKLEYSSDSGQTWQTIAGAASLPYNAPCFSWDISGLPDGRHYRVRVTSLSDPSVTDASRTDFRIGRMGLLTVQMNPPGPWFDLQGNQVWHWIDGNCANYADYDYSVPVGDTVTLTAPEWPGWTFIGWKDAQGNLLTNQPTYSWTFSVDQTAVAAYEYVAGPAVTGIAGDTGFSVSDGVTNDQALVIYGTAEANNAVTVLQNGASIGTAMADGSGAWSFDDRGTSLPQGSYSFTARDAAGNMSPPFSVVVDTTAPGTPVVTGIASETGLSPPDGITSDQTLVIYGTADGNSTVAVFKNGTSIGTTVADVDGAWHFDLRGTILPPGSYTFIATATDAAGNVSGNSGAFTVLVDTIAQSPTGLELDPADDTGASNADNITRYTDALTITGSGEAGATMELFADADNDGAIDAGESLGTAPVPDGSFTKDISLAPGTYQIKAIQTDLAGNVSVASAALNITVDTASPVVDHQNATISEGATLILAGSHLSATDADSATASLIFTIQDAPSHGQLQRDGSALASGASFPQADIAAGKITYTHDDTETASDVFTFTVKDLAGNETAANPFSISVNPVNDNCPVFTSSATPSIPENTTAVVTLAATDADRPAQTVSFCITGGVDQTKFEIVNGNELQFKAGPNYEAPTDSDSNNIYLVEVAADDGAGGATVQNLSVASMDVNEFDPVLNEATFSVPENSTNGTAVGTVVATDADATHAFSYSITAGNRLGAFEINASTGQLTVADSSKLDRETTAQFVLTVEVSDGIPVPARTDTATVTINLTDVNEFAPVLNDATFGIPENLATDTAVATLAAKDADATFTFSYSITAGNGLGAFGIDASTGQLTVADSSKLDIETTPHFVLTVEVSDGGPGPARTDTAPVTVNLTDVNEFAPVLDDAAFNISENSANGAAVGTLAATDADATHAFSYSITAGNGSGAFEINASTGQLTVADSSTLDIETTPQFLLTVEVSDGGPGPARTDTATVTITVAPVNDNTPVAAADAIAVAEGGTATALVGGATCVLANDTDADLPNDTLTVNPTPVVAPAHGTLTLNANGTFSYAHDGSEHFSDSFTYEVSDAAGRKAQAEVTITVTPVNDNHPVFTSDAAPEVREGTTTVVTLAATDADVPAQTVAFRITGGADQDKFEIVSGALRFKMAPDYEAPADADLDNVYLLQVTADDGAGGTTVQSVRVSVTDVNEFDVGLVTDVDAAPNEVMENAGIGTTVGITVWAVDGDATDAVSYSLTEDAGGRFRINASTGVVSVAGTLDDGPWTSQAITVKAASSDGSTSTADFTISVGAAWRNPRHHCDINNDGQITAGDVLALINEINARGSRDLATGSPPALAPPPFLDPNGDGAIGPADVLVVINYINAFGMGPIPTAGDGEGESVLTADVDARFWLPATDEAGDALPAELESGRQEAEALAGGSGELAVCRPEQRPATATALERLKRCSQEGEFPNPWLSPKSVRTARWPDGSAEFPAETLDLEAAIATIATEVGRNWNHSR